MSVLQIADTSTAVEIYNHFTVLSTKEIMRLFNCSRSAADSKKRMVLEEQKKQGLIPYSRSVVYTNLAFKVWGLDIADIEKRAKKYHALKSAGLF